MYKISFVQPNFQQGPKENNSFYLPYSIGVIWAYARQSEFVKSNFELDQIVWKRENLDETAKKLYQSDIVAFSTYIWNRNYNYTLAKKIKELNPNCFIIFGGPELPITKADIFTRFPFIDIVAKQEGEISFCKILESFPSRDFSAIKGLLINKDTVVDTGDPERIMDLEPLPSPYTTGIFDQLVKENPTVEWNATLETNRGCPFMCTFCDWGSLTYNKVKKFSMDKIFAELEWIGKNKGGWISIADANFGMFIERDNLIADKIIETRDKYGYPYTFGVNWAKNQKNEVIALVKKLSRAKIFAPGLTVSVQSLDDNVLDLIKRKNLEISKIESIFQLCEKENIPPVTELILGLPGETLETWKANFWKLFEAGNHTGVEAFQAQLLENAEMNLLQRKIHKMESVVVYDYMSGSYNTDETAEGVEAVVSTATLPRDKMLDAQVFTWFINTFHIQGLTTYIARFMRKYADMSYESFYDALYRFMSTDPWFKQEEETIRYYYNKWATGGRINHPKIGGIEIHGWNLMHRTILNMHTNNEYSMIYNKVGEFLSLLPMSDDIRNELLSFQQKHIINFYQISNYPLTYKFKYDILGYLQDNSSLENQTEYKFDFPENKMLNLSKFLELIYFGRRRGFGKARILKTVQHDNAIRNTQINT